MVFEYAQLKGTLDGMDTTVITEMAEYYEKEIGYQIPSRTPFVGKNFNVTRAGIHADGLLKNEEIYNIFDTEKFPEPAGFSGCIKYLRTGGHRPLDQYLFSSCPGEESHCQDRPGCCPCEGVGRQGICRRARDGSDRQRIAGSD